MAPPLRRGRARVLQQLTGLVFLTVLAGLVGLTVALYQKAFTDVTTVYVEADRAGNQLSRGADVKVRGLIVGEVRDIRSTGDGARLQLALQPSAAQTIPSDATAMMLPKTLFGEKFVALSTDDDSTAPPLREGAVIPQDRSATARETSQALDDLLPLLQTLRPQDLSTTLNALSSAVRGRGDRLGANLELVDTYLRQLNPDIPTLGQDLRGLADLADTLTATAPDLLPLLDDLAAVNRNLVATEQQLSTFLGATTAGTGELEQLTRTNEQRLVRLAADSLPSLQVYARYSPELPCLARGLSRAHDDIQDTFGGFQPGLHITLEFVEEQGEYRPGDEPVYGEDAGPTCRGLPPQEPIRPFPGDVEVTDGYCDQEERSQPGVQNGCDGRGPGGQDDPPEDTPARTARTDPARALAAPRDQERAAVAAVTGPLLGLAPRDVPDLAVLLFGPVARGTTVSLGTTR